MAANRQSALNGLHRLDGYLPIEDYGRVGDGATAALIGVTANQSGLGRAGPGFLLSSTIGGSVAKGVLRQ